MHKKLQELEQYSDTNFVLNEVYKGVQSEAVLLFLMPGQELPPHPHERFEVTLLPRKGQGLLIINGTKLVDLVSDTFYYEPKGSTFCIRNTGENPLEILITLVRVESKDSQS